LAAGQDAAESVTEKPHVQKPAAAEPVITGSAPSTGADSEAAAATQAPVVSEETTGLPAEAGAVGATDLDAPPSQRAESPLTAPPAAPPSTAAPPKRAAYRRPALALAALAVGVAVVTALTLILTSSPRHQAASSAPRSRSASDPATSPGSSTPGASTSPAAPSASASASAPAPTPSASPGGTTAGYGALPAGYYRFTNSTGFSIGVPDGWQISHVGHYVYITDPSNSGIFLLIDQSDAPKPNPLADWEQQAANRTSTYPDYHLIRLESVRYPQAEKAADWEFTFVRSGIPVHILNRNVLANAHHAYALYWSTPESDWSAAYRYFQTFAGTFRPAP
jgi:hypothetical protein